MDAIKYDFNMNREQNRKATFIEWPFNDENCNCTSEKMAAAGFYHCPTDRDQDIARCFVCFKELEGWEPEDDPWKEHKSHSPKCEFLALNKREEDMTVEEFLDLETKGQNNRVKKIAELKIREFEETAEHVKEEMKKLVP
ncbi:baculoviral IAP repeat-containing protein 5-like [Actinia tenebrosa]|uniref:Baculoviral IAP repeat-containing protein 5-like n=1 Tax=Actinia tenebrosa TaxID=6105 RepID=A0A6P8J6A1_ACTTE|nr:baculoviral IAP repeat-containing protein 5-like [Actinia tenebrosa]